MEQQKQRQQQEQQQQQEPDITRATTLICQLTSVSPQTRERALSTLRHLTKHHPNFRHVVATCSSGAALSSLSDSLYSTSASSQDDAAAAILNISISTPSKDPLIASPGLLDALSYALSKHASGYSPQAVQSSAAAIYSLSILHPSHRLTIGSKRDIIYSLVDIVSAPRSPSRSVKDALKAMFSLSLQPENRLTMLSFCAVEALFTRVVNDGRKGMLEDVTAVIAQLAGCQGALEEFRGVGGVRVLVDLVQLGETVRVRENAVSALLKLVDCGGEGVAEEIRGVGFGLIFDGLGEVVDCGTDKGKVRAQALMTVLENGMSSSITTTSSAVSLEENPVGFGSGPLLDSSRSY